jgi:hypothetical protein
MKNMRFDVDGTPRCWNCGKYNDPGNGRPYDGPASRRYRNEWKAEQEQHGTT